MKRLFIGGAVIAIILIGIFSDTYAKPWYKRAWSSVSSGASSAVQAVKSVGKDAWDLGGTVADGFKDVGGAVGDNIKKGAVYLKDKGYGGLKAVGGEVADAAVASGKATLKFASNVGEPCARASSLWAEWVAKKSAFNSLQGLISTQEITIKAARGTLSNAQKAYNAANDALNVAQAELKEAAQDTLGSLDKALKVVGNNFDKLFDINSVDMITKLSDLPKIQTPTFNVRGVLVGKPWALKMQLTGAAVKDATQELFRKMF